MRLHRSKTEETNAVEEQLDVILTIREMRTTLDQIEARVHQLEQGNRTLPAQQLPRAAKVASTASKGDAQNELEFNIGERWFGPVGIGILLVGIAFFIAYPVESLFSQLLRVSASLFIAATLYIYSRRWSDRHPFVASAFFAASLILLYLAVLRLHFYTAVPLIASNGIALALLVAVTTLCFFAAHQRRSEHLGLLALVLGISTYVCSNATYGGMLIAVASTVATIYLGIRYSWQRGLALGLFLIYGTQFFSLYNSPAPTGYMGYFAAHHYSLIYAFIYCALFGALGLFQDREHADWAPLSFVIHLINGTAFMILGLLITLSHSRSELALLSTTSAVFLLALAALYWGRHQSILTAAIYACLGYLALSVAIVEYADTPAYFAVLSWQSLLVVATAIWFRSKIIVVANILIYSGIFLVYLLQQPPDLAVNLSYAIVALLSARIMNWQKERFTLETETLRNIYLASAFVVVPYGLYHGVDPGYISLSWLAAGVVYFLLSIVLDNQKYRWMAILTIVLTVLYVFAIDLGRLSPVFRIISLLVLGLTMLVISLMYSHYRRAQHS